MVNVTSEVGRLRRALVHEPGPEIDLMVPAMMEQLLFDDILYGERARDEHARFRRVLQLLGVEVLDASDLLAETLDDPTARDWILDVALGDVAADYRRTLDGCTGEELAMALVAGSRHEEAQGGSDLDQLYRVAPLPNWCFQRDPQVVLGQGVIFCSMAAPARHREALLARAVFRFHPLLRDVPVLLDPIATRPGQPLFAEADRPRLEGGDVAVFSESVLAIGLSERTNRSAARTIARALARREGAPRWLVLVEVPQRRAFMHLDTLITAVDRHTCLVHAPVILGRGGESARVWEIDLHSADLALEPREALLSCLAARGVDLEPISCGGDDPVAQQREQWTDGANALAVAPGVITLFDRNLATVEQLARHGFRVVRAEDLLLGREELDLESGERACVLIASQEISRARGGPHCLVHPLVRDRLA